MTRMTADFPWMPILAYHRLVEETPADDYTFICLTRERFEQQMKWFARLGYRTLSLEEAGRRLVAGERIPPRHFVITFDDGYVDTLTVGAPILQRFGFTATVFVVSSLVGKRNSWDEGKANQAPLMGWDQIKEWLRAGFSVGSHTTSHPHLNRLSGDEVRHELVESRRQLEAELGVPVQTFCHPYGDWSYDILPYVRDAGYLVACNDSGRLEHGRFILARVNPCYWPPILTPLVRSQRWYFALNRSGALALPQRGMAVARRVFAPRPWTMVRAPQTDVAAAQSAQRSLRAEEEKVRPSQGKGGV